MKLALRYAVRSDRGLVRGNNEDSVYAGPRLLAIADGMGGHAGGEVASKIVIGAMEGLDDDRPTDDLITSLREAVSDANNSLADAVAENSLLDGMGTTLTAIRFADSRIGLVHVGDSRAYLLREGELTQITHDDTYVQSLVDTGKLTAEEASHHPRKSVILRALNGADVDPDVAIREVREHDRYLLCTDGLTDVLRAETLHEALSNGDPQECADQLVALALRGGGPDNVTCIVADVVEADLGDEVPVIAGAVVDPASQTDDDDSPAARAATLGSPAPMKPPAPPSTHRRERRWPHFVVPLVIVVILAAGGVATWIWTQTQYFVGSAANPAGAQMVAVYRGVNTRIGPVKFYRAVSLSAVRLADLKPSVRSQVEDGITADSRSDATTIVGRLQTGELLPLCAATPITTPTPAATPAPTSLAAPPPVSAGTGTSTAVTLTSRPALTTAVLTQSAGVTTQAASPASTNSSDQTCRAAR